MGRDLRDRPGRKTRQQREGAPQSQFVDARDEGGAGLLEQLELHIAPVLLGDGQRLFDPSLGLGADDGIELVATRVVEAPDVTHVRYTVCGRSKLVLDDRGASGDLVGSAQPEQSERSEP